MKLFVLVSRIPYPLEKGDKLRAYHQMKDLAKRHEIVLCCLTDKKADPAAIAHLETFCEEVIVVKLNKALQLARLGAALISSRPFQVHYFFQRKALRLIKKTIDRTNPDHIYCQLIRCSEYLKDIYHIPKTLDYMDALSKGMERFSHTAPWYLKRFAKLEAKRLTQYEHLIFEYFDHHSIISQQDKDLIVNPNRSKIKVIPNGVDLDFFSPRISENTYSVVFTGNMSYAPNVDGALFLANDIMPLVRKKLPTATLMLAGANPSGKVKALASEYTTVSGWMDDIRDAYAQATVFVAPMRIGTGLQNKLLESISMGIPSITSPLANNALNAAPNEEVLLGETAQEFADHIVRLIENEELRESMSEKGRAFVQENYSWEAAGGLLERLLNH